MEEVYRGSTTQVEETKLEDRKNAKIEKLIYVLRSC